MDNPNKKDEPALHYRNEPDDCYEKVEMDLIIDSLGRTYTERFLFATRLYKIQQTFKKAIITHKPYPYNK